MPAFVRCHWLRRLFAGLATPASTEDMARGNQIDFETFKNEFGQIAKAADEVRTKTMAAS